jgi:uncharacterized protein
MPTRRLWWVMAFVILGSCRSGAEPRAAGDVPGVPVAWQAWSPEVFATASSEQRLVLLDLGTKWCHWCHVMANTTYADPEVAAVIAQHFVAVEEDADRRLDLAARYQDYGWPATIVFDAAGRELWKQRGYVPPARMRDVLQRLVAAPEPLEVSEPKQPSEPNSGTGNLSPAIRAELLARIDALHDDVHGGFGDVHKYLDVDGVEWLLAAARTGDDRAAARLLTWLDAERALFDPVWGGVYQYSHGGVWTEPHFEKVMTRQLADVRGYALAHGWFGRDADLAGARDVARFLTTMLRSPEGAFFASQDADLVPGEHAADYFARDDAGRRELGVPRIETSLWSRENGQAIQGLCALLAVAADPVLQAQVEAAANWIVAHRRRSDGLFAHGDSAGDTAGGDAGGPFLADSLAMAGAFTALAEITADRAWLDLAAATLRAVERRFGRGAIAGVATAAGDGVLPLVVDRDENVQLARLANLVSHATGDATLRQLAERALAFASADAVALQPGLPAALLLANDELATEPVHVVVVGDRTDPEARRLHHEALVTAPVHRVVEWVAPGQPTARGEQYPDFATACAFVCANGTCSAPIPEPQRLRERLRGDVGQ